MAVTTGEQQGGQPVGNVFILYGTVTAVDSDGLERVLYPNSQVYAGERIVTGADGRVSLVFEESGNQLDLGRLSEALLDADVYGGNALEDLADAVAEVKDVQEALLNSDLDPSLNLPAPAAGIAAAGDGGGGHDTVVFDATGREMTPESGAETTGISLSFLDALPEDFLEEELLPEEAETDAPAVPVVAEPVVAEPGASVVLPDRPEEPVTPASNLNPSATPETAEIVEGHLSAMETYTVSGNLLENDSEGDGSNVVTSIVIGEFSYTLPESSSITWETPLGGQLTVSSDGAYSYTIPISILHENSAQGDGLPDSETFTYTIADSGDDEPQDTATSTLTINIIDTAPNAQPDTNSAGEGETVEGNVIFGRYEDGRIVGQDEQSADQGMHVIRVAADGTAYEIPLQGSVTVTTERGGTLIISSDGGYTYTAADQVDNTTGPNGENIPMEDRFTYTVADADGSTSEADLTIAVADTVDGAQGESQDSSVVSEEYPEEGEDEDIALVEEETSEDSVTVVTGADEEGSAADVLDDSANEAPLFVDDETGEEGIDPVTDGAGEESVVETEGDVADCEVGSGEEDMDTLVPPVESTV
ncbi:MAG: hypothetical protein CSA34_05930 [Desulfobulbus propionicus]|nr:MAG: hypothetical protein CSA34_05930 [Desulfobulbus propionicus]